MSGKRGKTLSSQSRQIVLAVDRYFDQERSRCSDLLKMMTQLAMAYDSVDSGLILPRDIYNEVMGLLKNTRKTTERVVAATGISKNTVSRIRGEGTFAEATSSKISTPKKGKRGPKLHIDNFDICAIKGIIERMYEVQKTIPTVGKILMQAKEDLNFPGGKTTLRAIIKNKLGYKFKKCSQKRMQLIERPNIRVWRARYLRRIRQNDALGVDKKNVVYLGDTWINLHYTISRCGQSSSNSGVRKNDSPGNRWIIVHAGNECGFVNGALALWKTLNKTGDHDGQLNGENFLNWMTNNLLPNIPPNSIIVMDSSSYHSVERDRIPTINSKKSLLQEWLATKGIAYSNNLTKVELYQLVKRNRPPKDYVIDNLMKSHGHEVLRLPPYNSDLNPIEYVWHLVKQRVAANNVDQLESKIEELTLDALASITADDWRMEVNRVKIIEQRYWNKEHGADMQDFILNTEEGASSEETGSSEDEEYSDDDYHEANMSGIEELE